MNTLLLLAGSYLLGAIPVGYLIGTLVRGIDVREHGSGNLGATNVFRVLGTGPGVITLLCDVAKGWLPVYVALRAGTGDTVAIAVGITAVLGHMFTLFLGFKGGKGVATAAGVFSALMPAETALAVLAFALVLGMTRYVSLSSMLAAVLLPITAYAGHEPAIRVACAAAIAIGIILKHRSNMQRLLAGTENKISFTRKTHER